jgi:hypothetical protein
MLAKNFHFTPAFSQLGRWCTSRFLQEFFFHGRGKMGRNISVLKKLQGCQKPTPAKSLEEGTQTSGT